jgi:hypothetical protein
MLIELAEIATLKAELENMKKRIEDLEKAPRVTEMHYHFNSYPVPYYPTYQPWPATTFQLMPALIP